jgi:hypothetical protein
MFNPETKRIIDSSVRSLRYKDINSVVPKYLYNRYKETERGTIKEGGDYERLQIMRTMLSTTLSDGPKEEGT